MEFIPEKYLVSSARLLIERHLIRIWINVYVSEAVSTVVAALSAAGFSKPQIFADELVVGKAGHRSAWEGKSKG
jgi:hypothetical protein